MPIEQRGSRKHGGILDPGYNADPETGGAFLPTQVMAISASIFIAV